MVGENDVSAIADEQVAVDVYALSAQRIDFPHERERIEYNTVADYATAAVAQYSAGNKLKDELLSLDGYGVPGIVSAGVSRDYLEPLGEDVNDFALALVAPLGSDNNGRLAWFQLAAPLAACREC
jgi:hypothetical protein